MLSLLNWTNKDSANNINPITPTIWIKSAADVPKFSNREAPINQAVNCYFGMILVGSDLGLICY